MTRFGASDTRTLVLDAALELVAELGLQGLTHRGVENRAKVSHGVTTYYFKNREALIEALIEHICDRQIAWIEDLYAKLQETMREAPPGGPGERYTRRALQLIMSDRSLQLACYETYLHAARNPHLRDVAARARERHIEVQTELFRSMGAREPATAALLMLGATEGLLLYQFSVPVEDFEAIAAPYITMLSTALSHFDPAQPAPHLPHLEVAVPHDQRSPV